MSVSEPADPRIEAAAIAHFEGQESGATWSMLLAGDQKTLRRRMACALAAADAVIPSPPDFNISVEMPEPKPDDVAFSLSLPGGWKVFTLYADGRVELGAASSVDEAASEFWECVKLKNPYARAAVVSPPPSDARCTCSPVSGLAYDCPEHGADAVAGRTAVASPPPPDGVQLYDALLGLVTCLDEGGNGEGWTIEQFLVPARAALEQAVSPSEATTETYEGWQVTRWWHVIGPDGELWCETSDEKQARGAMRPGDKLQRLWRREDNEWRDAGEFRRVRDENETTK